MKEEKLKQELTKKVEKKKLSIDSLLATLVFWAAIIASIALTICFFFGEKIDPLRIILKEDHECKGVGCGECGRVGLVMPVSWEPPEHSNRFQNSKKSPNNDW